MAWEEEAQAIQRHLEIVGALQRELVNALFRVAEQYDMDPAELATVAGQGGMHALFQPLYNLRNERVMQRQQEMLRQQQQVKPPEIQG